MFFGRGGEAKPFIYLTKTLYFSIDELELITCVVYFIEGLYMCIWYIAK